MERVNVDRRKILRRAAYTAGSLLLVLLAALASLPWLINADAVKKRVIDIIAEKSGGAVTIGNADVVLFPLPRVIIQRIGLSVPGKVEGSIETGRVSAALMPLLRGEVRLSKILLERPVVTVWIPEKTEEKIWTLEEIAALIRTVTLGATSLTLKIDNADISLVRHSRQVVPLKEIDIQADLEHGSGGIMVTIDRLSSMQPGFSLSGALGIDPSTPVISLELNGRKIDVSEVRKAALGLADDVAAVRNIFDIIREGTVETIAFQSSGSTPDALGKTENIVIRGRLRQGRVFIADPVFDFRNVDGDADISSGVLRGRNVEGRIERSKIHDGTVTVGLKKGAGELRVDAEVSADVGDVHAILKRIIREGAFRQELDHMRNLQGALEGRLVLGPSVHSVNPRIDISKMKFSAQYDRIPFPVEIRKGQFFYDEKGVAVRSLTGSAGNSSITEMHAKLLTGDNARLQIISGMADLNTAELHPWLASFPEMKETLRDITSIRGGLSLSSVAWEGYLRGGGEAKFRLTGAARDLVVRSPSLPDVLSVSSGKFDLSAGKAVLTDVRAEMIDASFACSGELAGTAKELKNVDLTLAGAAGPKSLQWIKDVASLPEYLRTDRTISFSQARFSRDPGQTAFQGSLRPKGGPSVDLDLTAGQKGLVIRKLALEDAASRALLSLDFRGEAVGFSLSGKLDTSTIAQVVSLPQLQGGMLSGDFRAGFDPEQATVLSAEGRLRGEKIIIPWKKDLSVTIDAVALSADNKRITVENARVGIPENSFSLKGSIAANERRLVLDMDISSSQIIWKSLSRIFETESPEEGRESEGKPKRLPVEGRLKIKADTLIIEKRPITEVQAVIDMDKDGLSAAISHARYCNAIITGKVVKKGKELSIDLYPAASGLDLKPAVACISDMNSDISGKFDLDGRVTLKGTDSIDLRSMQGNLNFHAIKGRVYRFTMLFKILTVLNLTDLFRGRLPDFLGEGFAYDSFVVKGDIQNGVFRIREADIDAPSVEITGQGTVDLVDGKADIRGKAAPFRTLDALIRVMPWWKKSTLISFPFHIQGKMADPEVASEP